MHLRGPDLPTHPILAYFSDFRPKFRPQYDSEYDLRQTKLKVIMSTFNHHLPLLGKYSLTP
jgi:hypothetical protein